MVVQHIAGRQSNTTFFIYTLQYYCIEAKLLSKRHSVYILKKVSKLTCPSMLTYFAK